MTDQKAQTKVYKCYISDTGTTKYYWYFNGIDANIYGNESNIETPAENITQLDRVANVHLYSINDLNVHIVFDQSVHIYGIRDVFFDLKETDNADSTLG